MEPVSADSKGRRGWIWKVKADDGSLKFVVSLYDSPPLLVDISEPEPVKYILPSMPKHAHADLPISEKQAAQDAKNGTTVTIWTASGEHIVAGTNKGWLNIIDAATKTTIYSSKITTSVIVFLRLTSHGKDLLVNAADRIIRTIQLPNLAGKDLDPDTIALEIEHKFQDVVNKLSWNHVAFSSSGEYVTASTFNNHDIYIWERNHGSLVKILEGPKEEHGQVEWHPHRPLIAACGLETGRIHIWSIVPQQRWSALAPDFAEVEENVEYIEHEDEFDIHDQEEVKRRRLDLEDEDIDVLTVEPAKGEIVEEAGVWRMPVQLDLCDSESEEEFIAVGRGEMRRKSPGAGKDYVLEEGSAEEGKPKKGKKR